jgi:SET domain-containing protein
MTTMEKSLILVKNSRIHGRGVFAKCDIPKGTRIIEYVGEKITKAESDRRAEKFLEKAKKKGSGAVYIFQLNQRYDIDGNVTWNPARLINHA